ncbi:MAG TPA: hypothetical protein VNT52_18120 [Acidimicrobiales bacterium]|nr:hypothetical protein [Acidimicrobiales bacterium]
MAKAVAEALTKAQGERDAAVAKAAELEAELAKANGGPAGESEEEALAKALATMPEPVRKAWLEGQERIAKAEAAATKAAEDAKVEKDARVSAEYLTKAKGTDYSGLPTKAETLGTVLREVDEKLSDVAKAELHRLLKAGAHAVTSGGDFREYGGAGEDVSSATGAQAAIEKAADDLQRKEPNMDRATAITKAYDLHPDLARAAQPQGGEG